MGADRAPTKRYSLKIAKIRESEFLGKEEESDRPLSLKKRKRWELDRLLPQTTFPNIYDPEADRHPIFLGRQTIRVSLRLAVNFLLADVGTLSRWLLSVLH